jgi:glycerol-3-phosphate acyltransferase PlsY
VGLVLAAIIGYLVGSLPVALAVGRAHGVDLRTVGDRNPGAWNAMEQLGGRAATPVFVGDGLKGSLGGLAGLALGGVPGVYVGVAAAMVGHALPMFAGFRGGKSVMTFAGGAFVLAPPAALGCLVAFVTLSALRDFRLGARVGVFGFPLAQILVDPVEEVAATGALMSLIGLRYLTDRLKKAKKGSPI